MGSDRGNGGTGSYFDGPHAWNMDFSTDPPPRKLAMTSGHHGHAFDVNGNGGYLQMNDSICGGDWLCFTNYQTGEYFSIINQGDLGWWGHLIGHIYSPAHRGWALVELYAGSGTPWCANQLLLIEVKPSSENPRIWRVAHTQSTYNGYRSQPNAVIDITGTKIYFGSNWRGTDNMEVYEVTLPANWLSDLGQ